MARHERNFRTAAEAPLTLNELMALLGPGSDADEETRGDAIACYLSGSEGWRDAAKQLGGAFAEGGAGVRELKDGKTD